MQASPQCVNVHLDMQVGDIVCFVVEIDCLERWDYEGIASWNQRWNVGHAAEAKVSEVLKVVDKAERGGPYRWLWNTIHLKVEVEV